MAKLKNCFETMKGEFVSSWNADSPYSNADKEWMQANPGKAALVWCGWMVMGLSMVAGVCGGVYGLTKLAFTALQMLG